MALMARGPIAAIVTAALWLGALQPSIAQEPKKVSLEWLGATASIDPLYA